MKIPALLLALLSTATPAAALEHISHPLETLWPVSYVFSDGNPLEWHGRYGSTYGDVAVPGVLALEPGDGWSNFIAASQTSVPYTLHNVEMRQSCPTCQAPVADVLQSGAAIQLWRPLLCLPVGTVFELTLDYTTQTSVRLPGEIDPSISHREVWRWRIEQDLSHAPAVLDLLHSLPFGASGVPLIADESLYTAMRADLQQAASKWSFADGLGQASSIDAFITEASSSPMAGMPLLPLPSGAGIGVASTSTSPAVQALAATGEAVRFRSFNSLGRALRSSVEHTPVEIVQTLCVSRVFAQQIWVQDTGRAAGLRVTGVLPALAPGDSISALKGTLTGDGPERYLQAVEMTRAQADLPARPLTLHGRDVGGKPSGWLNGIDAATSIYNASLLVRVTGRVTLAGSALGGLFFYLDDGSGARDPAGTGIRVIIPPGGSAPVPGEYATVTGVSTHWRSEGVDFPAVAVPSGQPVIEQ